MGDEDARRGAEGAEGAEKKSGIRLGSLPRRSSLGEGTPLRASLKREGEGPRWCPNCHLTHPPLT